MTIKNIVFVENNIEYQTILRSSGLNYQQITGLLNHLKEMEEIQHQMIWTQIIRFL